MLDLYQQQIIDRAQHPLYKGVLEGATHRATGANLSCGDEITFQAKIENHIIEEIRFESRACAICTASADMVSEQLQGKPLSALQAITKEGIEALLAIPLSPIRLKCALLPLETLKTLKQT